MTTKIKTVEEFKEHIRKLLAEEFPDLTAAQLHDQAQLALAMGSATKSPAQQRVARATYQAAVETASSDDPSRAVINAEARKILRALSDEDLADFAALGYFKFLTDNAEDVAPNK